MTTILYPAPKRERFSIAASWCNRLASTARSRPRGAILLGFCSLSFLLFSPTWTSPFSHLIGAPGGDQVGFFWALEWPIWAVAHGQDPLFSTYLNAPDGFNVMWTYPPLLGFLMAPVTLIAGPVFSYNLLVTLGLATSAWLMALATRRFVPHWGAAIAAGLLFGFGPYELSHALAHVVLVAQFAAPLVLLLGHECLVRQRWRPWQVGAALGLVVAAQFLVFVESAAILVIVCAIGLIAAWLVRDHGWRRRLPYAFRSVAVACVVFTIVCAYPLWFMLLGPQHMTAGPVRDPGAFVSNLANFVVPTLVQLVAPSHTLTVTAGHAVDGDLVEWNAYLGIPLLIVLATVLVRCWWRERLVRFLGFTIAVIVVLSLGQRLWLTADTPTSITLPAALFIGIPLVENILWSRVAIIVDLLAAVLLAIYLRRAQGDRPLLPRSAHRPLMMVLALSLLPLFPYPSIPAPVVPAFFTGAEVQRIPAGSTALVAPFTRNGDGIEPEYWQLASGFRFRMTGGYVFVPGPRGPSYVLNTPLNTDMEAIALGIRGAELSGGERAEMLTELTQDHIGTVIVGPMPNRGAMVQFMTTLLGRSPQEDQGVQVWWSVR